MKYRNFGKSGWQASVLGFGTMRFPTTDGAFRGPDIDEKEAARMVYHGIENGINYIDTAYPYHQEASERFLGKILQGKWREKIRLATKLPAYRVETYQDFDRYFNEQLNKLQTDHFDLYLLHSMNKNVYKKIHDLGVLDWAESKKKEGRIIEFGFSFHDDLTAFKNILDSYTDWDFCQIQYNYMNTEYQAGIAGLKYAHQLGLPVVIMEPLLGGKLAQAPGSVQAILDSGQVNRSPAEWAFNWLWNQPEVSVVLSGMSTMEQLEQNLATADNASVGMLSVEELAMIDRVRELYNEICPIPCTACNYCQPCPNNVSIPEIFGLFNEGRMYGTIKESRFWYGRMPEEKRADQCIQCLECETACPQSIQITDWLIKADLVLGQGKSYEEALR